MKIASITAAFVFVAATAAWDLKVVMQNGQAVKAQGNLDSGCVNYGPDVTSPVDRAVFHESKQANTFELYETKDCKIPVSYRNTKGDYKLKPMKIQSYKVYEDRTDSKPEESKSVVPQSAVPQTTVPQSAVPTGKQQEKGI